MSQKTILSIKKHLSEDEDSVCGGDKITDPISNGLLFEVMHGLHCLRHSTNKPENQSRVSESEDDMKASSISKYIWASETMPVT